ncbi:hypothetical protein ABKV19_015989 [Rosa sericea]
MGRKNTNEIGGSGSQAKAVWNDFNVSKFCDLCIKLVDAGRRPNTHFDREGWESLVVNFSKETGNNYDKTQLKNKWDSLKIEWKLWKELVGKETGLGWNPSKGTVDAPAEWWHSKIQVNPEYAKLRKKGLNPELEEKLDRMFSNIIATGEHAWAPSCGNLPSPKSDICKDDVIPLEGSDDSVDFTPIEINGGKEGVSRRGKKRLTDEAELQAKMEKKPKGPIVLGKQKVGGATKLSQQIDRFIDVVENKSAGTLNSVKSAEGYTIAEAMKALESVPYCEPGNPLWLFATRLFLNKEKREMFATMKDDVIKLQWLQYEYAEK